MLQKEIVKKNTNSYWNNWNGWDIKSIYLIATVVFYMFSGKNVYPSISQMVGIKYFPPPPDYSGNYISALFNL